MPVAHVPRVCPLTGVRLPPSNPSRPVGRARRDLHPLVDPVEPDSLVEPAARRRRSSPSRPRPRRSSPSRPRTPPVEPVETPPRWSSPSRPRPAGRACRDPTPPVEPVETPTRWSSPSRPRPPPVEPVETHARDLALLVADPTVPPQAPTARVARPRRGPHPLGMPHAYIVECCDGSYYVGSTWDLERRIGEHNLGLGAAYTRRRRPVRLVWSTEFSRIEEAYLLEKQIQGWGRAKRQALIDGRLEDLPALSRTAKPRATGVSTGSTHDQGSTTTRLDPRAGLDARPGLDRLEQRLGLDPRPGGDGRGGQTISGALTRASSASWSVSFSCDWRSASTRRR